jgi:hypothetical protein
MINEAVVAVHIGLARKDSVVILVQTTCPTYIEWCPILFLSSGACAKKILSFELCHGLLMYCS